MPRERRSSTDARTRLSSWWNAARERTTQDRAPSSPPAAATDLTSTLANLADLHRSGELTDEEYAAAKARVLAE